MKIDFRGLTCGLLSLLVICPVDASANALLESSKYPNGGLLAFSNALSIAVWESVSGRSVREYPYSLPFPTPPNELCSIADLGSRYPTTCRVVKISFESCENKTCVVLLIDAEIQKQEKVQAALARTIQNPCYFVQRFRDPGPPSPSNPDVYLPGLQYSALITAGLLDCLKEKQKRFRVEQSQGRLVVFSIDG
jgi:hypothetical protein